MPLGRRENSNMYYAIKYLRPEDFEEIDDAAFVFAEQESQQEPQEKEKKENQHQDILNFICDIRATSDFSGGHRQIWCKSEETGEMHLVRFFKQDNDALDYIKKLFFRNDLNYYITKNSFTGGHHSDDELFSIDNIVIDLDVHDADWTLKKYATELDYYIDKLIYIITNDYNGQFPEFNAVRSGRGVQLWIGLVSFSARVAAFRNRYKRVCEYFVEFLKHVCLENGIPLKPDKTPTCNISGLMRLPYTYNQARYDDTQNTGYKVQYEHRTDYKYTLDEIQEFLPTPTPEETKKPKKPISLNSNNEWAKCNRKRANFIESIILNNNHQDGRRELLLFDYCNAYKQFSPENAGKALESLNEKLSAPLPSSQIHAISNENVYAYSTENFLDSIQATSEERCKYGEITSVREQERKRARENKDARNKKIEEMAQQGASAEEIATEVDCSARTVRRKTKTAAQTAKETRNQKIRELHSAGFSVRQIAAEVGCSTGTVQKITAATTGKAFFSSSSFLEEEEEKNQKKKKKRPTSTIETCTEGEEDRTGTDGTETPDTAYAEIEKLYLGGFVQK